MNSQVSQVSEKQIGGGKGMCSDGDAATQEVLQQSNVIKYGGDEQRDFDEYGGKFFKFPFYRRHQITAIQFEIGTIRRQTRILRKIEKQIKSLSELNKPRETIEPSIIAPPAPPPSRSDDFQTDGQEDKEQSKPSQNQTTQNQTQIMPDTRNVTACANAIGENAKTKN